LSDHAPIGVYVESLSDDAEDRSTIFDMIDEARKDGRDPRFMLAVLDDEKIIYFGNVEEDAIRDLRWLAEMMALEAGAGMCGGSPP